MLTAISSAKNLFSPIKFFPIKPGQTPYSLNTCKEWGGSLVNLNGGGNYSQDNLVKKLMNDDQGSNYWIGLT
jgi:hypothetical protein